MLVQHGCQFGSRIARIHNFARVSVKNGNWQIASQQPALAVKDAAAFGGDGGGALGKTGAGAGIGKTNDPHANGDENPKGNKTANHQTPFSDTARPCRIGSWRQNQLP
jgi:hypothetical protein